MSITKSGTYEVQWYGNRSSMLTGAYRPQWVDKDNRTTFGTKSYVMSRYRNAKPYTNLMTGPEIRLSDIVLTGFTLTEKLSLRMITLQRISDDDSVDWTIVAQQTERDSPYTLGTRGN